MIERVCASGGFVLVAGAVAVLIVCGVVRISMARPGKGALRADLMICGIRCAGVTSTILRYCTSSPSLVMELLVPPRRLTKTPLLAGVGGLRIHA